MYILNIQGRILEINKKKTYSSLVINAPDGNMVVYCFDTFENIQNCQGKEGFFEVSETVKKDETSGFRTFYKLENMTLCSNIEKKAGKRGYFTLGKVMKKEKKEKFVSLRIFIKGAGNFWFQDFNQNSEIVAEGDYVSARIEEKEKDGSIFRKILFLEKVPQMTAISWQPSEDALACFRD